MLKAQVLSAIRTAKSAVQDLAVACQYIVTVIPEYIPGSTVTPTESATDVSVVFTKFGITEIDGERIQASDWKGLVFPESNLDFDTNHVIRVSTNTNISAGDYRIIANDKVMVGDTVGLHQLQLRMLRPS